MCKQYCSRYKFEVFNQVDASKMIYHIFTNIYQIKRIIMSC